MQIRSLTQIQWRQYQKSDAIEPREKKNKTKQNKNWKRSKYKKAVVERFTLRINVLSLYDQCF